MNNEQVLAELESGRDTVLLSVPDEAAIIVPEQMQGGDWLCFRLPVDCDLPSLGTALIRAYFEALGGVP